MKATRSILLVEDNPADIKITERALRQGGIPVELIVVRDGQEALDYLLQRQPETSPGPSSPIPVAGSAEAGRRASLSSGGGNPGKEERGAWRRPDLILLDLNLPRLPGRELLQRIRATPALRSVPVIVLTTSRRPEDVQGAYAAGANTYIEKPNDFNRFVEILQILQRYWLDVAILPPDPAP
jgi:two-component system, chemotaxis family, response regulator Rcp1